MADALATVSQPPVEAGRAAHSAPSRSTPVAPHSSASLGGLPDELKQLVARHVYLSTLEVDAKDQDERVPVIGYFAKKDEADRAGQYYEHSPKRGLRSLSLVDRSFRAVCLPLLFEDFELREGDTTHGDAQSFLDCNARHIRHLSCTVVSSPHHKINDSEAAAFKNAFCDVVANCVGVTALKLSLGQQDHLWWNSHGRAARTHFVADVALDQLGPALRRLQSVFYDIEKPALNHLPGATALQSLSIQFNRGCFEKDLATLVNCLPTLVHLRHLRLGGSSVLSDELLNARLAGSVTSLELHDDWFKSSFVNLHGFISSVSSTLTALNLGLDGRIDIDSWPLPAYNLPQLETLSFGFSYPSALNDAFPPNSAPLAIVHMSHIHDVDFALADIVQFLNTHARTLQRVHVGGTDQDDDDWAPLNVSPHAVEQLLQLGEDLDIEITGLVSDGPRLSMAVPLGVLG